MADTVSKTFYVEADPAPPSRTDLFVDQANQGLWRSGAYGRDDFLTQLRGRRGAETWREMVDNDPVVGAVLFEIDMVLRRVEWTVEPTATGPDGEVTDYDLERADFLRECMGDMSHSWEEFISDALTMLPYGFSSLEIVYKRRGGPGQKTPPERRSDFSDGKVAWRKFVWLPQNTIDEVLIDSTGGVQGMVQNLWGGRVQLPIEKLLLFRTTRRAPLGRSVLRSCYRAWYLKKRTEQVEGIGVERDLAGLPVIYADPDYLAAHGESLQNIVRNIRRDEQEGVLFPMLRDAENGSKLLELTLLTSGGTRQFNTGEIIARHNRAIAMSLLQDVILLGHEKVGTQALATEKRDLSDTALQAWLNEMAGVLNCHAVPRLFELNGMPLEACPKFVPGELRPTDVLEFTEAIKNLAAAGFILGGDPEVENEARRRVGLPLLEEGVTERLHEELLDPPEPPPVLVPAPEGAVPDGGPETGTGPGEEPDGLDDEDG